MCYGFLKILIWTDILKKKKNVETILEIFMNFQNFENPR